MGSRGEGVSREPTNYHHDTQPDRQHERREDEPIVNAEAGSDAFGSDIEAEGHGDARKPREHGANDDDAGWRDAALACRQELLRARVDCRVCRRVRHVGQYEAERRVVSIAGVLACPFELSPVEHLRAPSARHAVGDCGWEERRAGRIDQWEGLGRETWVAAISESAGLMQEGGLQQAADEPLNPAHTLPAPPAIQC